MSRSDELIHEVDRWSAHNYHPLPVVLQRGEGCWVWDVDGNRYLDMLSASHTLSHKLWLEVVARCIDLGVDGMDFRIRCHKSSVE